MLVLYGYRENILKLWIAFKGEDKPMILSTISRRTDSVNNTPKKIMSPCKIKRDVKVLYFPFLEIPM